MAILKVWLFNQAFSTLFTDRSVIFCFSLNDIYQPVP